jgi:hypothetical protein
MIRLDLPPTGFMLTTFMFCLWVLLGFTHRQARRGKRAPGCVLIAGVIVTVAIMLIEWYRIP